MTPPPVSELSRVLDGLPGLRVLVLGEAMLDSYLSGQGERLCREAPVPIVNLEQRRDAPGGAANAAANARALGAEVRFLSVIGDDAEGAALRRCLAERRVDTGRLLLDASRCTLTKTRVSAAGQLLLRFDQGSTSELDPALERMLLDRLTEDFAWCEVAVVSDYGHGIISANAVRLLAQLQATSPRVLAVDSKHLARYREAQPTAVKPNYAETTRLLGLPTLDGSGDRARQIAQHASRLHEASGARIVAASLDAEGAVIFERGAIPYRTHARPTRNSLASGAGDTFLTALALALGRGASTPASAELAAAAAGVVVERETTAACSLYELRARLSGGEKVASSAAALASRLDVARRQGKRLVLTSGCFDLLHPGHIAFLHRARALGDILAVGLNADACVSRLKGPGRPIHPLASRFQILGALSCVDCLVSFEEPTPEQLIRAIRPDVFVKGSGYSRETLPEAGIVEEVGGRLEILPHLAGQSTADLIRRIREEPRLLTMAGS